MHLPPSESDESFESADEDFDNVSDNQNDGGAPTEEVVTSTCSERPTPLEKEAGMKTESKESTDTPVDPKKENDRITKVLKPGEESAERQPKVEASILRSSKSNEGAHRLRGDGPLLSSPWLSSFLKSASDTVVNLKTSVTESARLVMESVDTTLGAPDPKDLALRIKQLRMSEEEKKDSKEAVDVSTDDGQEPDTRQSEDDAHYVNKLASFWKTPGFTTFVSTGLDALENVGRKTIDILRADRLEDMTSKIVGSNTNEESAGKTLSMLVSEARKAETRLEEDVKTNSEMEFMRKSAMKAEERIQTECVKDPSLVATIKRMQKEMQITEDDRDTRCVEFNVAINEFEQAMQSAPWSLTLDWNFVSKALAEVELELNSLAYGHADISDVQDKCITSVNKVCDASIRLFALLSKNCEFTSSVKNVAVSLLHISTACVQNFAQLIKKQSAVSDKQLLSDVMSQIFFKESDLNAEIEDAYNYLQRCIIAHAINNSEKRD